MAIRRKSSIANTIKTAVQKGDYATPEKNVPKFTAPAKTQKAGLYSAYRKRTQSMGASERVNSRPLQQKKTTAIGMTEPTPRRAGSMSVGTSSRRTSTSNSMLNRGRTAMEKRDYAIPESDIGRRTRNKMINKKYGR